MYEINLEEISLIVNLYRKIIEKKTIDDYCTELLEKIIYISQFNSILSNLLDKVDFEFSSTSSGLASSPQMERDEEEFIEKLNRIDFQSIAFKLMK